MHNSKKIYINIFLPRVTEPSNPSKYSNLCLSCRLADVVVGCEVVVPVTQLLWLVRQLEHEVSKDQHSSNMKQNCWSSK